MNSTLFHISDRPDIARFDPRPSPSPNAAVNGDIVWAIDEAHLHNYLLPRDCPRVTWYAAPSSAPDDLARLMGGTGARHIVAIETAWFERVREARLFCYELPATPFVMLDEIAGYFVAYEPVTPLAVQQIDDVLGALLACDVELRVTPSLWPLRDLVAASSLPFSIIRMRNAQPREAMHRPL